MQTIYKYPLRIEDEQEIEMPSAAKFLSVQVQPGVGPCLWALVDTDNIPSKRMIQIRGTGHPANGVGEYIDTFQMHNGGLVFHAFGK